MPSSYKMDRKFINEFGRVIETGEKTAWRRALEKEVRACNPPFLIENLSNATNADLIEYIAEHKSPAEIIEQETFSFELSDALKEINSAKSLDTLKIIYNLHGSLHGNKDFMSALTGKKAALINPNL